MNLIPFSVILRRPAIRRAIAWDVGKNSMRVIARSVATKQSSWIAAVGFAALAMTNIGAFISSVAKNPGGEANALKGANVPLDSSLRSE